MACGGHGFDQQSVLDRWRESRSSSGHTACILVKNQ